MVKIRDTHPLKYGGLFIPHSKTGPARLARNARRKQPFHRLRAQLVSGSQPGRPAAGLGTERTVVCLPGLVARLLVTKMVTLGLAQHKRKSTLARSRQTVAQNKSIVGKRRANGTGQRVRHASLPTYSPR